jgi:hypothetical protein
MKYVAQSAAVLLSLAACEATAATDPLYATLELREPIGRAWSNELVSIETGPLPSGAVRPGDVAVTDRAGKLYAAQLDDVALHEDGSLRRARVWTLVTLPADSRTSLALTRRPPPALERPARAAAEEGGLVLDDGMGRIAVRLPAAAPTNAPRPLREMPAPIRAVRLSDGRWAGRGRLIGDTPIRAMAVEVTAPGPLFAAARVTYLGENDRRYRCDVRVTRGEPAVFIEEEFNLPAAQQGPESVDFKDPSDEGRIPAFEWVLSAGFAPDAARYKSHTSSARAQTIHRPDGASEGAYDLALTEAGRTFSVIGYMAWHADVGAYWIAYEKAGGPQASMLGIVGTHPGRWYNPAGIQLWTDPKTGVSACLPLGISHRRSWEVDAVHDAEMDTPIHSGVLDPDLPRDLGRRAWALCTLPKAQAASEDYALDHAPVQKLVNRLSKFPLEKVRHWVLEWDSRDVRYPRLFGAGATPEFKPRAPEEARRAIDDARQWMRDAVEGRGRYGHTTFHLDLSQALIGVLQQMDTALSRPDATEEEASARKALAAFITSMICDEQFMPRRAGFHMGNPNMPLASESYVGMAGCMMPSHPQSSYWAERAVEKLAMLFERYTEPTSGAWEECPHYMMDASFRQAFSAFVALRSSGYADLWELPSVKRALRYALALMSPPDPRFGIRILGTQGNGSTEGATLLGWAASAYRFTEPELSAACQWMWDADGRPMLYPGSRDVIRPELPMRPPRLSSAPYRGFGAVLRNGFPDPNETWLCYRQGMMVSHYEDGDQGSWHLYAKGAPLSLDFSSQYGPMMWRPWLHNRISVDHKVDPMILSQHDVDEFLSTDGADFVSGRSVIDRLQPMPETPYDTPPADPNWGRVQRISPVTWRRGILFVKDADVLGPNYFVVLDTFEGGTTPTDWSSWSLAEDCVFDGNVARFRGQYGVDLDVVCLRPAQADWVRDRSPVPPAPTVCKLSYGPGVAGWPEESRAPAQPHPPIVSHNFTYLGEFWKREHPDTVFEERQICARLRQPAGEGYLVLLYPRRHEGEEVPRYEPWADRQGARLGFSNGCHYVLSASAPISIRSHGVAADAATAVVRDREGSVELDLVRGTRLEYRDWLIEGSGPVALRQRADALTGEIDGPSRGVTIGTPARLLADKTLWLDGRPVGKASKGRFTLSVTAGRHSFRVERKP